MKVTGPGTTQGPSGTKKTRSSSGASGAAFADAMKDASGASDTAPAGGPVGLGGVNPLLGLQLDQGDDEQQRRDQATARAEDLLDHLEKLRTAVLSGFLPAERLNQLIGTLNERRAEVSDEKLVEILDEIELRARVELAKYSPNQ